MHLATATQRAIEKAFRAREKGQLTFAVTGILTLVTGGGRLRFLDGVCFDSPDPSWVGADLVGWLEEVDGLSGVGAWWRPGLRAVLQPVLPSRSDRFALTRPSETLERAGSPVQPGFATHSTRFLVAQGEADAAIIASCEIPVPPRDTGLSLPAALTPAPSVTQIRSRGTWPSTTVVPWNLGEGSSTPARPPRRVFGPLPPVRPPPRRPAPAPSPVLCSQAAMRASRTSFEVFF
jgi:hypothetical protein